MKHCVITSLYQPYHRGGAEVICEEEVKSLQNKGNEVLVITIGPWKGFSSIFPKIENSAGVKIYRFYPLNIFSFININAKPLWQRLIWLGLDVFNLHSYFTIKGILKREKPEVVLSHNVKGLGYLTWRAIRKLRIKNIQTLHDVQLVEPSGLIKFGELEKLNNFWHKTYFGLCRFLVGSPTEVISPSKWLMDFYIERVFFKSSQATVNLAFGKLPAVKNLDLTSRQGSINLLYVGQVEEHKGILWLVDIIKKLKIVNCKLKIVGDGSKLEMVKQLVGGDNRFEVCGRLDRERVDKEIEACDFVVVPSLCYENSPTIISQGLNKNKPVIAANIGGIGEMVQDGVNGWLFEAGDEKDLLAVLRKISS